MASSPENVSMALFCDFENVALGVRDANYEKFDIKLVLERLLLKGSIVVKKAYCDWERYKGFKATMHEANFELIEIPHVRQSGKNSADIRLVVDALDLCYTKSHVNTFVIISGDSDFSPLVSKLRENAKQVIGVGVKQSTSDLLIANCDEFIFYDDLVRETRQVAARREPREAQQSSRRSPEEEKRRKEELDARRTRAVEIAAETFEALLAERGDTGKIWASVLKEAIKRRKPDFSETRYGFRAFGNLLEEAQSRGLLEFGRDEKSGTYVYRSGAAAARTEQPAAEPAVMAEGQTSNAVAEQAESRRSSRRGGRGGNKPRADDLETARSELEAAYAEHVAQSEFAPQAEPAETRRPRHRGRRDGGKPADAPAAVAAEALEVAAVPEAPEVLLTPEPVVPAAAPETPPVAKESRRRGRSAPKVVEPAVEPVAPPAPVAEAAAEAAPRPDTRRKGRGTRKATEAAVDAGGDAGAEASSAEPAAPVQATEAAEKPARKAPARSRRPRKQEEA
ncbi:NYN domain-containing protein [Zoogloea sp.]|uniref:NYN domain-containing protein n=1 Tax=Zoogloea sp. TaxID=49181 RepID=UPI0025E7D934|nr:NYN domain-containing protein [Zoogloea sp.]MCK6396342.1 NYN domain-containing protein [Zoogloea sp.]